MTDALEFGGVPHPVIERFVLPEGFSCATHGAIRIARRDPLDDARDFGKGETWVQENVDVVGHDDVGVQDEAAEIGTAPDGVFGVVGKLGVGQPERTKTGGVESGIEYPESLTRRSIGVSVRCVRGTATLGGANFLKRGGGQGAVKPPSDEDGFAFGVPVGEIATVEGHKKQILKERFAIGEPSSGLGASLRQHSQEWLCHQNR